MRRKGLQKRLDSEFRLVELKLEWETKTFKIMSLISKTFELELMNLGKVKEI